MRIFVMACVALLVVAGVSVVVLDRFQKPAETAFASPSGVRI